MEEGPDEADRLVYRGNPSSPFVDLAQVSQPGWTKPVS